MLSEAATCNAVIGLDVGKFSHWACHVSRRGEVLGSGPVANTEHDLDSLLVPPVRPGDRSQNRVRAGDQHKHQRLSRPRPPRILQSGKSISSVSSSRQGNKRLENLPIFSCSSLSRSKGRFGDYYRRCRDRGMSTGRP